MAPLVILLFTLLIPIQSLASHPTYPLHDDVLTTMFYVGEKASADNDYISNESSAWITKWEDKFGCVDDPNDRIGYLPMACFKDGQIGPKENPFYFALPFGDYGAEGVLKQVAEIPWYDEENGDQIYANGGSLLMNRWIEISYTNPDSGQTRVAYAQWLDVGPGGHKDGDYVWKGDTPDHPKGFGLDVSPAVNDYLGLNGLGRTSWRFIDADQVPDGWWKAVVSISDPDWSH